MDLRRFWMTWRRDIMRGAGLFAVVLIAGLTIGSVVGRVRRGFNFNFDGLNSPELAGPAAPGDTAAMWTWSGKIAPKQSVWLKNVNGEGRNKGPNQRGAPGGAEGDRLRPGRNGGLRGPRKGGGQGREGGGTARAAGHAQPRPRGAAPRRLGGPGLPAHGEPGDPAPP